MVIIDPSLRSGDGHHLGFLHRYRVELAKLQVETTTLASLFASDDFSCEAGVVPTFERSLYYRTQWSREEFKDSASKFFADLKAKLRKLRLRPDIIILPAADQSMILGLARYLRRHRFRSPPEILIWLVMAPNFRKPIDDPSVGPLFAEYREAFAALRQAVPDHGRIHVCCETDVFTRAYEPFVGLKVETVVVHKTVRQPRNPRVRRRGEPINIVCTGNANAAKGYSLLPDAIESLNRKRRDLRFLIHGTVEHTDDPEGRQIMQRLSGLGSNVIVRTDVLPADDYLAWLAQADFILLPYDPARYRKQRSGVFSEAEALGIPVIATKDCDFVRSAIAEGRAVGIDELTPESLASAVQAAADRVEEMTARAAGYAANLAVDHKFEALVTRAAAAAGQRLTWFDRMLKRWPWGSASSNGARMSATVTHAGGRDP